MNKIKDLKEYPRMNQFQGVLIGSGEITIGLDYLLTNCLV